MRVVLFTGAGTSAEAGIPTFRSEAGEVALWNSHDPKDVCNIFTYRDNIEICREFYNDFRQLVKETQPTDFHRKVSQWQNILASGGNELLVITQNVDDLFERAGVKDVLHIHGDIRYMQCCICDHRWYVGYERQEEVTTCPQCEATFCKPGVVFFGENAPAYEEVIYLLESLSTDDALVVMGTSCSVFPIHYFLEKPEPYKIFSALDLPAKLLTIPIDEIILDRCTVAIDGIISVIEKFRSVNREVLEI